MNFLDLIFPKRCVGCGKVGNYFCDQCSSIIRIIELNEAICPICEKPAIDGVTHPRCRTRYSLDGLTSFFRYDGVVKKAIKAIKYRYVSDLAREFVSLIPPSSNQVTMLLNNQVTRLIPIPLHAARLRYRGFNQAEKLGSILAEQLHIPMETDILRRMRETKPQVEMRDRAERLGNMKDVFIIDQLPKNNAQLSVILFDDVFTTGATMHAAANLLKRNGIKSIWAVTMAR